MVRPSAPVSLSEMGKPNALHRQVVNQTEWVFDIAPRKIRLVFDDLTALLYPSLTLDVQGHGRKCPASQE